MTHCDKNWSLGKGQEEVTAEGDGGESMGSFEARLESFSFPCQLVEVIRGLRERLPGASPAAKEPGKKQSQPETSQWGDKKDRRGNIVVGTESEDMDGRPNRRERWPKISSEELLTYP